MFFLAGTGGKWYNDSVDEQSLTDMVLPTARMPEAKQERNTIEVKVMVNPGAK